MKACHHHGSRQPKMARPGRRFEPVTGYDFPEDDAILSSCCIQDQPCRCDHPRSCRPVPGVNGRRAEREERHQRRRRRDDDDDDNDNNNEVRRPHPERKLKRSAKSEIRRWSKGFCGCLIVLGIIFVFYVITTLIIDGSSALDFFFTGKNYNVSISHPSNITSKNITDKNGVNKSNTKYVNLNDDITSNNINNHQGDSFDKNGVNISPNHSYDNIEEPIYTIHHSSNEYGNSLPSDNKRNNHKGTDLQGAEGRSYIAYIPVPLDEEENVSDDHYYDGEEEEDKKLHKLSTQKPLLVPVMILPKGNKPVNAGDRRRYPYPRSNSPAHRYPSYNSRRKPLSHRTLRPTVPSNRRYLPRVPNYQRRSKLRPIPSVPQLPSIIKSRSNRISDLLRFPKPKLDIRKQKPVPLSSSRRPLLSLPANRRITKTSKLSELNPSGIKRLKPLHRPNIFRRRMKSSLDNNYSMAVPSLKRSYRPDPRYVNRHLTKAQKYDLYRRYISRSKQRQQTRRHKLPSEFRYPPSAGSIQDIIQYMNNKGRPRTHSKESPKTHSKLSHPKDNVRSPNSPNFERYIPPEFYIGDQDHILGAINHERESFHGQRYSDLHHNPRDKRKGVYNVKTFDGSTPNQNLPLQDDDISYSVGDVGSDLPMPPVQNTYNPYGNPDSENQSQAFKIILDIYPASEELVSISPLQSVVSIAEDKYRYWGGKREMNDPEKNKQEVILHVNLYSTPPSHRSSPLHTSRGSGLSLELPVNGKITPLDIYKVLITKARERPISYPHTGEMKRFEKKETEAGEIELYDVEEGPTLYAAIEEGLRKVNNHIQDNLKFKFSKTPVTNEDLGNTGEKYINFSNPLFG